MMAALEAAISAACVFTNAIVEVWGSSSASLLLAVEVQLVHLGPHLAQNCIS
jgi:hypothetical protein